MATKDTHTIRAAVRERYAHIATSPTAAGCCDDGCTGDSRGGYSADERASAPLGADLGLGCGNPTALAQLAEGDVVLDLGSGAGFDCFIAARAVGPAGRVIGVDMTPEMVSRARRNAETGGYDNVEFRLGEIEALPLERDTVDVILSNCVINLSPEKERVFAEAFRVLRPGGRLTVSDMVLAAPLPAGAQDDLDLHCACVTGAVPAASVEAMLRDAGFEAIRVIARPARDGDVVVPATIEAVKPR